MAATRFVGDTLRAQWSAQRLMAASGALAAGHGTRCFVRESNCRAGGFALVRIGFANVVPILSSARLSAWCRPAAAIATVSSSLPRFCRRPSADWRLRALACSTQLALGRRQNRGSPTDETVAIAAAGATPGTLVGRDRMGTTLAKPMADECENHQSATMDRAKAAPLPWPRLGPVHRSQPSALRAHVRTHVSPTTGSPPSPRKNSA